MTSRGIKVALVVLFAGGVLVGVLISHAAAIRNGAEMYTIGFDHGKRAGIVVGRMDEAAVCVERHEQHDEIAHPITTADLPPELQEFEVVKDACDVDGAWSAGYGQGRDDWRRRPFLEEYAR